MRLIAARVRKVMSVHDSGRLALDEGITTIVGKNESGKTAMLQALYRANPLPSGHVTAFTARRDYPRRDLGRDREVIDQVRPVTLEIELDYDDRQVLERAGALLPTTPLFVSRSYGDGELHWASDEEGTPLEASPEAIARLTAMLPGFQYFDDHNVLPGSVSIRRLQEMDSADLYPSERTALALLRLAGVADASFDEDDYEVRKAALEAAAARLSDQLLEYWSQNRELSIELDLETMGISSPDPWLHIRVRDDRQRMSLNVAERSKGFIWFFSFLAAFSEFADQDRRVILLDEPGMNLHANAQADLLRYIKEHLGPFHQVVYSTHSPYLIDSGRLSRCRVLENVGDEGSKISSDLWRAGSETTVPLLAALGADLTRKLVSGPHQLLVSSPSDITYLTVMGDLLRSEGGRALDPRWNLTPVGGASGIPTILALLGTTAVSATVLMDGPAGARGAVEELVNRGAISSDHIVPLTDITGTLDADLEDLFDSSWYVALLEESGGPKVSHRKITGKRFLRKPPRRRIVHQAETVIGGAYDRFQPAGHLLRNRSQALASVDAETKKRFQQLIDRLNALL
ncbi:MULTISPECIES: ATP-dependent nuclease [unclassified Aeromicrobium]|uniref:ATP-dependent nuclease n=1 Tax=unclassified Aeromicrobium TaxID=2633570 RepID=UPI00288A1850|nr:MULTISPECIES: ATP-binding protein [unclassified Aeromicrobium]